MCDVESTGVSSIFKFIRNPSVLTICSRLWIRGVRRTPHDHNGTGRMSEVELLKKEKSGLSFPMSLKNKRSTRSQWRRTEVKATNRI